MYNLSMTSLKLGFALVMMASLAIAASTTSDHDSVSPPRVNERPIDNGSEAPYVPVTDGELLGQMESTINDYNAFQLASSGVNSLTEVPPGSPPYR